MEALRLAKNKTGHWTVSEGTDSPQDSSLPRTGYSTMESPLAAQLQAVWLQTQLPKRNVPKLDFLSPFPSPLPSPEYFAKDQNPQLQHPARTNNFFSYGSPSFSSQSSPQPFSDNFSDTVTSQSDVGSVGAQGENDTGADSDPMEDDYILQNLSDIMMEEENSDQKCMYVQCSAYHAMEQELADLIGDTGPAGDPNAGGAVQAEKEKGSSNWIDEFLNTSPQDFLREDGTSVPDLVDEVSSIATGITNIKTGYSPEISSAPPADRDPATAEKEDAALDLECPYLENETTVDAVDYTNGRSGVESLDELSPLLTECAKAVAADDVRKAHQLINHLRQKSSPFGDGGQRLSYYIVEALVARLSGTGARLYTALSSNRPSSHEMLKAYRMFVQCNPLPKISHFFANATIINAVKGSDRIHIIDYGILYGVQWPCLLRKLAQRPGGPPRVRITGIEFAQPGFQKNERVEETGRRLAEKAKLLGVEFEYHAIAGKWETIQPAQLALRSDETLIVNCMFRLRNLLDETVMASSPRKMVLGRIHSLNPKLFVMGVISAGYNSPFFMARFQETINHFSALFDAMHSSVPPDTDLRRMAEKEIMGREILNVIACEGTERIERAETYRQWHSRSLNAGFKQELLDPSIVGHAQEILRQYHRNYGVAQDGQWLLTGWADRVLHGLTSWTSA